MMEETLKAKVIEHFIGKVVRKDLAFLVKGGLPVPTYVLEYLLGQYCASDDEQAIEEGIEKVKTVIRNNYVNRADAEQIKGKIRESGRYRIIDKVTVTLNEKDDQYQASFANLGLNRVPVGTEYVTRNPKLLSGNGVWCIVTLGYIPGDDVKVRWEIQTLKPIQISNIDLHDFIDQRKHFSTDEWIDFMIHTVGLNPEKLNHREKFITLARLLPHIENNFNFMELGPKGTGKSHVFQELSPYGVLVSGGDVTSARLFVSMAGRNETLGLVGYWDVVAWDEFEQQKGRNIDPVLIDTMQNYLANKSFNRGKGTHEASASMVFVGNTKHTVPYMLKNTHLFESIPTSFIKGAFLDRIHLYNPGWEIKMLKKDSFSKGYGMITDYIAAVLHELRNYDWTDKLKDYATFDGSLSERDHLAIRKTFSGMMKLLYPDGNITDEEAYELVDFAAECRKRVKDQLYKVDETFKAEPARFQYENSRNGKIVKVQTLEYIENEFQQTNDIQPTDSVPISEIGESQVTLSEAAADIKVESRRRPRIVRSLASRQIDIRENQKGVSYKGLFGEYLKSAHKIVITDPFIRAHHQFRNLLELIQTILDVSDHPEELSIEVHTQGTNDEQIADSIDKFDTIEDDLTARGVEFKRFFDADHDRSIRLDNGWCINLGRGLDIFDRYDPFSLAATRQENRSCKPFTITIINQKLD